MDKLTELAQEGGGAPVLDEPAPGMPPESPVPMPEQSADSFSRATRRPFIDPARSRSPRGPRLFVLGGAFLLLAGAVYEMYRVLEVGGLTSVEAVVLVFFALNFAWIALAFLGAIGGFGLIVKRRFRSAVPSSAPIAGRTAMLMPTFNENPERVFAAVEAMARATESADPDAAIDWFILSDTTDPRIVLAEEAALMAIRARLGRTPLIYYRHRRLNIARKAGNIADFCRRWGGTYDYMIVLDADSLMEPATILELIRRMEADPDAGLIQTVPMLVNGRTPLARLQQFAGRVYGPVIAAGLAWLAGSEGNYWGHNAVIRRRAFTEAAGLPHLKGPPPFGGHILSHDFVEAALIRRAGWTVRIADDLRGSYEEGPPSLIDLAVRDRRWCQGNLQHSRLLATPGFHWMSRLHLLTGIMSYVASPLWLLLLLAGLALSLQAQFIRPEYFPDAFQLFPTWPAIDAERSLRLFGLTLLVLFGPKVMGLLLLMTDRVARRASGGGITVLASFIVEILVSALVAPIMMLIQTGMVFSILRGRDAGWSAQRRDVDKNSWGELFNRHRLHVAAGIVLAIAAESISPVMVLWLLPAIAGLVLAIPVSGLTASAKLGARLRNDGILSIPEETHTPAIETAADLHRPAYREIVAAGLDVVRLLRDDRRRRTHLALIDRHHERQRGHVDPVMAVAAAKIAEARSVEEALSFLDHREQVTALATPELCERLAALPFATPASAA
jgi:membrane glycosyltransferase